MGKYSFSVAEKWAVYSIHGDRCYLCTQPIDFASMEVDHIVPERLLGDLEGLAAVRKEFGLASTFNLNDFENWLPACRRCNGQKSDTVFTAAPIIAVHLERAKTKASAARAHAAKTISDRKLGNALAIVELAVTRDDLPAAVLQPVIESYLNAHPEILRKMLDERDARSNQIERMGLGFQLRGAPLLSLLLTSFATVEYRTSSIEIVSRS